MYNGPLYSVHTVHTSKEIQFHAPVKFDICQPCSRQPDYRDSSPAHPFLPPQDFQYLSISTSIGAFNSIQSENDLLHLPPPIPPHQFSYVWCKGVSIWINGIEKKQAVYEKWSSSKLRKTEFLFPSLSSPIASDVSRPASTEIPLLGGLSALDKVARLTSVVVKRLVTIVDQPLGLMAGWLGKYWKICNP